MTDKLSRKLPWVRYALALLAGLTFVLAFPNADMAGLAWITPALLLAATLRSQPSECFRLGYLAGLVAWLGSLYWLLLIPVAWAPILGWLALSAYLALYPAVWVWLVWQWHPGPSVWTDSPGKESSSWLAGLDPMLQMPFARRALWAFSAAALWVALEMMRARFLTGFAWNFLGASQYHVLPVIQIASWTGVYGVSFLVAWVSVALFSAALVMLRQPVLHRAWSLELLLPGLTAVLVVSFGYRQLMQPEPNRPTVKMVLVQPSIPQQMIWNQQQAMSRFGQVLELAQQALEAEHPDIMVWPEAAMPSLFRLDPKVHQPVMALVRKHGIWLILGADDALLPPGESDPDKARYFNASFLLNPQGELAAVYYKRRLVMFGEYVPLARWFPFLRTLAANIGDFTPGDRSVPFELTELGVKTSVLICFEDTFPHGVRADVRPDIDFLLNLTNDGWFGRSAAQWQHAANAAFRAVENGLPLVRCTNNGLTCWIDAKGRMHAVRFEGSDDIYQRGWKAVRVPVLAGKPRAPTFYGKHGDWLGWGCVAWSACVGLARWARRWLHGRRAQELQA